MKPKVSKRLPKADRRDQLLETAQEIVASVGTDALTLGYLAERAGVSKPIAYEHFKTRAGLLIALARRIDDRQVEILLADMARVPKRLEEVARVASTAYMHCAATVGPQWHAIFAALSGAEEMEGVQQELLDRYATIYQALFAPLSDVPQRALHARCVAIVGAAEALSRDMLLGRIEERAAAKTLASLMVEWLSPKPPR